MTTSEATPPAVAGAVERSHPIVGTAATSASLAAGMLRTARPKQWVKNVLVLAAPAAAGKLTDAGTMAAAALAFVAFTFASICTYYVNDAMDHEADRLHPRKRFRPIAAGIVPLRLAWLTAATSLAAAFALSFGALGWQTGLLISTYLVMTFSYSTWLKHVAVVDLVCVAAGFVLRMIGGGIATDIPISNWFLTVACFSSLFVVAGKRYAEVCELGEGVAGSRSVLGEYTAGYLRVAWAMAMAVAVASYYQWAFERAAAVGSHIWYQLSAVPWVIGLLRYALLLDRGHGGAPEDVLLSDRVLQVVGAIWLALFLLGVYDH